MIVRNDTEDRIMTKVEPGTAATPPKFTARCRDLTGQSFGRLTVTGFAGRNHQGYIVWACRCSCGKETLAKSTHLLNGMTTSCGCYIREVTSKRSITHGRSRSPEAETWRQTIQRCTNPKNTSYHRYGGRGIRVHPEWRESFAAFFESVGPRPGAAYSLDRIDNNGHYEPGNVRWATPTEQGRNRTTNRLLTYGGETLSVAEWADRLGLPYSRVQVRIQRGLPVEKILAPGDLRKPPVP